MVLNLCGNGLKVFAATCLERSRETPLTARLDLEHDDYYLEDIPVRQIDIEGGSSCHYRTILDPLLDANCTRRICELDVHLSMVGYDTGKYPDKTLRTPSATLYSSHFPYLSSKTSASAYSTSLPSNIPWNSQMVCSVGDRCHLSH